MPSAADLVNMGYYGRCKVCSAFLNKRQKVTCSIQCQAKWLSIYHKQKGIKPPSRLGKRIEGAKHRYINKHGYVVLREGEKPKWEAYEHRFVMEQYLGRKLTRKEHVHHLNGDKTDNRLENLLLMGIKEHGKYHSDQRSFIYAAY